MIAEQAGTYKINLFERKDLVITYINGYYIDISNNGNNYFIDNCQMPTFAIDIEKADNNSLVYVYTVEFMLNDLTKESINMIEQLTKSIYGYCAEILYNNGKSQIYNVVLKLSDTQINGNESHIFNISLENKSKSLKKPIDKYYEIPNWLTADNDIITADNNLITVDQITY